MNFYNLDKLIKITVIPARLSYRFHWREESRGFFGLVKLQERGIYSIFDQCYGDENGHKLPSYLFLKDFEVFEYPRLHLTFEGKITKERHFKTIEEAKLEAERIKELSENPHLLIL